MAGTEALTYNPKLAAQLRALRNREKSTPASAFMEGYAGEEEESGSVMSPGRSPRAFRAGQMANIINDASGLGKAAILPAAVLGKHIKDLPRQIERANIIRSEGVRRGAKDLDIASEQASATGLYTGPSGKLVGNVPLAPEDINVDAMKAMMPGERVALQDVLRPGSPYATELPDDLLKRTLLHAPTPTLEGSETIRGASQWWNPLPGRPDSGQGNLWLNSRILDKPPELARTFGHEVTHGGNSAATYTSHGSSVSEMVKKLRSHTEGRAAIARKVVKGEPLTDMEVAMYADDQPAVDKYIRKMEKDPRMMTASEWAGRRDPVQEYLRNIGEGEARAAGALSMFDPKVQRLIPATQDPFMTGMQSTGTQLANVPAYYKPNPIDRVLDPNSWTQLTDWDDFNKRFVK